jgi:putative transcriptional regulator
MAIKSNLSRILGEKRIKMSELAEKAGVAKNTVLQLYHERAKGVTFEVLNKICTTLNCTPGDLLEFVPDDENKK